MDVGLHEKRSAQPTRLLSAEGRNLNNDVDYLNASSVGWAEHVKPNNALLAIRAGSITRLPVPIFDQYSPV